MSLGCHSESNQNRPKQAGFSFWTKPPCCAAGQIQISEGIRIESPDRLGNRRKQGGSCPRQCRRSVVRCLTTAPGRHDRYPLLCPSRQDHVDPFAGSCSGVNTNGIRASVGAGPNARTTKLDAITPITWNCGCSEPESAPLRAADPMWSCANPWLCKLGRRRRSIKVIPRRR